MKSKENPSWFLILMEEVYEAFSETDPTKQRAEMIQVISVGVQIVEYLNRVVKKKDGNNE